MNAANRMSYVRPRAYPPVLVVFLSSLIIAVALTLNLPNTANSEEPSKTKVTIEGRVQELIPDIEAYITSGMKGFDVPGPGHWRHCEQQAYIRQGFRRAQQEQPTAG
jgi:hypothetical protein